MDVQICHFWELTIHLAPEKLDKLARQLLELKRSLVMNTIVSVIRSPVTALQVEVDRDLENKRMVVLSDLELLVLHLRISVMPRKRVRSMVFSTSRRDGSFTNRYAMFAVNKSCHRQGFLNLTTNTLRSMVIYPTHGGLSVVYGASVDFVSNTLVVILELELHIVVNAKAIVMKVLTVPT